MLKEILESVNIEELVKTLEKFDATIINKKGVVEYDDVIDWAGGSIIYSDLYCKDFDMDEKTFNKFARDVYGNAKEIAKELNRR